MVFLVEKKCPSCGEVYGLHPDTNATLMRSGQSWCCPWGHSLHYPAGPSEADKLRLERDRLKQRTAQLEDEARTAWATAERYRQDERAAERRAAAARGQVTRLKNRAAAGVCPCCNRSFENLRRHMQAKHKGFALEETAPIGATVQ